MQLRSKVDFSTAVEDVRDYFGTMGNGRPKYSGSRFETLGEGVDTDPHRITATDLVAVSMLSVDVPAQASLGILETLAEQISELLSQIPQDLKFENLTPELFEKYLDEGSPADKLWSLLRQHEDPWKVGQTTASKIMARKRPDLIPVYDSVVKAVAGIEGSGEQWIVWYSAFHDGSSEAAEFVGKLRAIRAEAGQPHLSLLRILDIALWKQGKREIRHL
ncbi:MULTISPECIES: DUF6308 family protein [Glutamicibacter]|uniref:Uncharacterized protein n=2 Tax=Glutamicibacter arilaitensis TaxID=256701 RepID=A0ABM9PVA2_GLUAR|nr:MULTISPECIES: DUF6308 family protein [Glutamicibacter]CBT75160.1 conserved hypothetical protein [Glutamicibacter arilaitensis Re117]HCM93919.1 hypothetical protein [Glutamicibacter sp.]